MPHYRSGIAARAGDFIIGKGYNIKGQDGELATIVGVLLGITPGSSTCNIVLATVEHKEVPEEVKALAHSSPPGFWDNYQMRPEVSWATDASTGKFQQVKAKTEYGQADHFDLVHRPGVGGPADVREWEAAKEALADVVAPLVGPDGQPVEVPDGGPIPRPDGLDLYGVAVNYPEGLEPVKLDPAGPDDPAVIGYGGAIGE